MSEKRYSYKTVAEYLHIGTSTLVYRARVLGIDGKFGFTADDVKLIENYQPKHTGGKAYGTTLSELAAEMKG